MLRNRLSKLSSLALLALTIVFPATAVQAQTFSVLYNFGNVIEDPQRPWNPGRMAQGRDGNLYTTSAGGGQYNTGTVYNVTPTGQVGLMYSFGGIFVSGEGSYPSSGLVLGTDGNFYGAAYTGGVYDEGTVFKISPSGALTQLYDFTGGADGGNPLAAPVQGVDGNLYGTAAAGGANHYGTVYKITAAGKFTILHTFVFGEGNSPSAPLIQGGDGNFYGTTSRTAFKITPAGKLTVLFTFDGVHGASPVAPLIQAADGNFYGTAQNGGAYDHGVVYKITSAGHVTVLYSFCPVAGCADGAYPNAGLVQAGDGNFYGVAAQGGAPEGYGTLYKITPSGTFSVLHTFDIPTGWTPVTLVQHTNGILYGEATGGGNSTACGNGGCGTFYSLNMGLAPFVSFLPQQASGKIGGVIGIFGQGFSAANGVSFGGTPAIFTVSTDGYLTATIPSGALSGPVAVTTLGGTLTTHRTFHVIPQIKSFSPPSGPVGTFVQITGASLLQTTKVTFGGVPATTLTVDSDTQITATVPASAKTGRVAITTSGGSAASAANFTVTP